MKIILALIFALSIYILTIPTHSAPSNLIRLPTTSDSDFPVLDTDGDKVRPGLAYYITSVPSGPTREVKLGWLDSTSKCSSDVIMTTRLSWLDNGDPITITPSDSNANAVLTSSTFHSFAFNVSSNRLCQNKLSWNIRYDRGSAEFYLTAGEFVADVSNRFKIEADPNLFSAYKINYCVFGSDKCYDVGRYYDTSSSSERLGLSDLGFRSFIFRFKKVTDV